MSQNQFVKVTRPFTVTKSLQEDGTFEGYASVYGIEDHHGDKVIKGAFSKGLQKLAKEKRKVKMLWNHDRDQPIGVYKEIEEDDTGIYVRGKLTLGVQKADETRLLMLDEAVDSMSIGGYVTKDKFDHKTFKRDLLEIELREISPTVFPALDAARVVSVKSLSDGAGITEVEKCLRDAGFSTKDAKRLISIIKAAPSRRDVDSAALAELQSAINSLRG